MTPAHLAPAGAPPGVDLARLGRPGDLVVIVTETNTWYLVKTHEWSTRTDFLTGVSITSEKPTGIHLHRHPNTTGVSRFIQPGEKLHFLRRPDAGDGGRVKQVRLGQRLIMGR